MMKRNTRSGRTFSEWSGLLLHAPEIDLTERITSVLQAQAQSPPAEISPPTIEDTLPTFQVPPETDLLTTSMEAPAPPESPPSFHSTSVPPSKSRSTRGRRGGKKHQNHKAECPEVSHTSSLPSSNPVKPTSYSPLPTFNRKVEHGHALRKLTRQQLTRERGPAGYQLSAKTRQKHFQNAQAMTTKFHSSDIRGAKTGYVGKNRPFSGESRLWSKEELLQAGFEEVKWDGRESVPIADAEGVIFGLLLGSPQNDPSWLEMTNEAAGLLDKTRLEMDRIAEDKAQNARLRGYQPKSEIPNRRGDFTAVTAGNSFGGGQRFPKPLQNDPKVAILANNLTSSLPFTRLAHHSATGFAAWAPRLHQYYAETLQRLRDLGLDLPQKFPSSVFAAATFNCGPQTVTLDHLDFQNYVHGWCSITALGSFNYEQGGHLVLWDLGLIIQFPPGSTILIPSAYLRHSNATIGPAESRYSFTQYTAGGLFRYVEDSGQVRRHMSSLELIEVKERYRELARQGLNMYSSLDELSSSSAT